MQSAEDDDHVSENGEGSERDGGVVLRLGDREALNIVFDPGTNRRDIRLCMFSSFFKTLLINSKKCMANGGPFPPFLEEASCYELPRNSKLSPLFTQRRV